MGMKRVCTRWRILRFESLFPDPTSESTSIYPRRRSSVRILPRLRYTRVCTHTCTFDFLSACCVALRTRVLMMHVSQWICCALNIMKYTQDNVLQYTYIHNARGVCSSYKRYISREYLCIILPTPSPPPFPARPPMRERRRIANRAEGKLLESLSVEYSLFYRNKYCFSEINVIPHKFSSMFLSCSSHLCTTKSEIRVYNYLRWQNTNHEILGNKRTLDYW